MKSRIDTAENPISNVVDKYESDVQKKSNVRTGQEGVGHDYKRATSGIFVVTAFFCVLTVEVENGPKHAIKLYVTKYAYTPQ